MNPLPQTDKQPGKRRGIMYTKNPSALFPAFLIVCVAAGSFMEAGILPPPASSAAAQGLQEEAPEFSRVFKSGFINKSVELMYRSVKTRMTTEQVEGICGKPDVAGEVKGVEHWYYNRKEGTFQVVLFDDKVTITDLSK